MIRNAYLGLESFYIGPLRNEMCIQAIAGVPAFGYAYTLDTYYVCIYICAYVY